MKKFTRHVGIAAPIIRNNVDTDAIIPSVEMKKVSKKGLSDGLFASWRYSDRIKRVINPDFVLNLPEYDGASIILSGKNFGCGSSREHAVWALAEFGIRVIIAPSFGSIFQTNCIANGLLPIRLPANTIEGLVNFVEADPQNNRLQVDLEQQKIRFSNDQTVDFQIRKSFAEMLINGWDAVAVTLQFDKQIQSFQQADKKNRPWIYL